MKKSIVSAVILWFVLSVLFLGTPTPLMVLLPGIFVVDAMMLSQTASSIPVIIMFGSLLNLAIYVFAWKAIGEMLAKK